MAVQQNDYFGETYFEIFRDEMSRCLQLSNGTVKIYAERSQEIMKKKIMIKSRWKTGGWVFILLASLHT